MRKKKAEQGQDPETGVDKAPAETASPTAPSKPRADGRLTPLDIQQIEFRRSFKGYEEREVDEFLDRLTEDFAAALDENQRMRSRLESGLGAVGAPDPAEASRQADEIVQRARAQAAQIVRDAETRSATIGAGSAAIASGDTAAIAAFVAKERAFLQQLASLVQDHAEGVKSMVRASAAAPAPRSAPETSGREPSREESSPVQKPVSEATQAMEPVADPSSDTGAAAPRPASPESPASPRPTERPSTAPRPQSSETISVPEPEPQPRPVTTRGPESDPSSSEDEQSLRELFWGDG